MSFIYSKLFHILNKINSYFNATFSLVQMVLNWRRAVQASSRPPVTHPGSQVNAVSRSSSLTTGKPLQAVTSRVSLFPRMTTTTTVTAPTQAVHSVLSSSVPPTPTPPTRPALKPRLTKTVGAGRIDHLPILLRPQPTVHSTTSSSVARIRPPNEFWFTRPHRPRLTHAFILFSLSSCVWEREPLPYIISNKVIFWSNNLQISIARVKLTAGGRRL